MARIVKSYFNNPHQRNHRDHRSKKNRKKRNKDSEYLLRRARQELEERRIREIEDEIT